MTTFICIMVLLTFVGLPALNELLRWASGTLGPVRDHRKEVYCAYCGWGRPVFPNGVMRCHYCGNTEFRV